MVVMIGLRPGVPVVGCDIFALVGKAKMRFAAPKREFSLFWLNGSQGIDAYA
jgi:hypothetical protein